MGLSKTSRVRLGHSLIILGNSLPVDDWIYENRVKDNRACLENRSDLYSLFQFYNSFDNNQSMVETSFFTLDFYRQKF